MSAKSEEQWAGQRSLDVDTAEIATGVWATRQTGGTSKITNVETPNSRGEDTFTTLRLRSSISCFSFPHTVWKTVDYARFAWRAADE